ncbi:MAG: Bor family protein [Alphaproteobacteria bacterium]|nr:Bor family protein [Alphaproteobacteria bacterium]
MKKHLTLLFCAFIIAVLSSCSTQNFEINPNPTAMEQPSYEGTNHFLLWGFRQVQTMHPGEACGPEGVSRVETKETFINGLLSVLTLGIYAPRDYAVYCNTQFRFN